MIYLRTGKPGASKSLNSIVELVDSYDPERPQYYTNVTLFMLDYEVASSFSGWFYGWYFPRLKNNKARKQLIKIMRRVHDDDEFLTLEHVPWLEGNYNQHDHFQTWLHWVRQVYSPKQLELFEEYLTNTAGTEYQCFEQVKRFNLHFTRFDDARKWYQLPKRSVIWIDECQQFFPPRGVGSKVPEHIAKFETHRHHGYDIHLVTQDPKLIDVNIRRLTGRHVHYHNAFGGERVTRYQNSKAFDPDQWHDTKACEKKLIRRAKAFYGVYWSAEIHTHKFKMPKFVFIGAALCVFIVLMFSLAYYSLFADKQTSEVVNAPGQTQSHQVVETPVTVDTLLHSHLKEMLKGVYIDGVVVTYRNHDFKQYDYSFSHADGKGVFTPEDVGLLVIGIKPCLAKLNFDGVDIMVTCNPFYKRPAAQEPEDMNLKPDTA
ncbi:zonular occludens toxin domain-containing protein [Photobacterium sp. J15]|uniref:zonular occludens toxin domain-containing protein n=1 Tax=Photobacterium sp. J15 TaxID=265901 RepID=UPI0007E4102A|nr:zonular occludens toxin domain-containing protein [Photobacterium sp. J15]